MGLVWRTCPLKIWTWGHVSGFGDCFKKNKYKAGSCDVFPWGSAPPEGRELHLHACIAHVFTLLSDTNYQE